MIVMHCSFYHDSISAALVFIVFGLVCDKYIYRMLLLAPAQAAPKLQVFLAEILPITHTTLQHARPKLHRHSASRPGHHEDGTRSTNEVGCSCILQ